MSKLRNQGQPFVGPRVEVTGLFSIFQLIARQKQAYKVVERIPCPGVLVAKRPRAETISQYIDCCWILKQARRRFPTAARGSEFDHNDLLSKMGDI